MTDEMTMVERMEKRIDDMNPYPEMNVYMTKDKEGVRFLFMSDASPSEVLASDILQTMYPLKLHVDSGDTDFTQYIEFSGKEVWFDSRTFKSCSVPIPQIKLEYMKAVRRIKFTTEQPESATRIMKYVSAKIAEMNQEITEVVIRNKILETLDKVLNITNGYLEYPEQVDEILWEAEKWEEPIDKDGKSMDNTSDKKVVSMSEFINKGNKTVH